jgi:hypothetical protein
MRKTAIIDYQSDLFDLDTPMKKSEESKNITAFPTVEFPREKEARERMRRRREAGVPKQDATPEPPPKQVVLETEPPVNSRRPSEGQPITPPRQQQVPRHGIHIDPGAPETAKAGGTDRIVTALIGASGLAAAGMSIYHGYHYLLSAGKPSWVAMITAVVMVVFTSSIFAFPVSGRKAFGYALRILGLGTLFFSIFSTVAVNYNQFTAAEHEETAVVRTNEMQQTELAMMQTQLAGIETQIETARQEAEYWKDKSWARRDAADRALQKAYTNRLELWRRIHQAGASVYQVVETKTIFMYLAALFNIEKSRLEFILFCIPAVFYDVLSALAVNAVLGRR